MQVYRTTEDVVQNSNGDAYVASKKHFIEGLSLFRFIYLFLVCGIIGFIGETIWCFILYGEYRYCGSLLYGPINVVYGFGGLAFYFCFMKFLKVNKLIIFVAGLVLGCGVEYLCSLIQEAVLGSVSWDYSHMPMNINGRTCLQLGLVWGAVSVFWVSILHPGFEKIMRKIPDSAGRLFAVFMVIILTVDIGLSLAAVTRWKGRMDKMPAVSAIDRILDTHYPDAHMESVFKSMKHD